MIEYGTMSKSALDIVAKTIKDVFDDQLYQVNSKFQ